MSNDVGEGLRRVPGPTMHQKDQLLALLQHYLPMGLRARVMQELPQAYNAWVGWEVVEVRRTVDAELVRDYGPDATP